MTTHCMEFFGLGYLMGKDIMRGLWWRISTLLEARLILLDDLGSGSARFRYSIFDLLGSLCCTKIGLGRLGFCVQNSIA